MNRLPAAQFLHETGLLFEINRKVLHPLGLALEIIENDDGTFTMSQHLQDCRPETMTFSGESTRQGEEKLAKWKANR
jgi:hypothetical protein